MVATLEELAGEPLDSVVYRLHDEAAAVHLFRVAAGLDSLVPGEAEILGQVRARVRGRARPGRCSTASSARRSRSASASARETAIGESPASVPAAAAALAQQVFGDLRDRRVLVVGAGRMGELATANLSSRGATIAYVANRSEERAVELAERFGATPIGARRRGRRCSARSTSCSRRRARPGSSSRAADVPSRRRRPLFFIDLAVPRNVDPAVHELDGCYLYDVDDLEAVVAETLSDRRVAATRAEQLVAEEAERFREWQASLEVVPAIASLRARAEEIRAAELAKLGRLSEHERQHGRVGDRADPEQAPAPADRADEAGGGRRRRDVRRRGHAPVRARGGAVKPQPPRAQAAARCRARRPTSFPGDGRRRGRRAARPGPRGTRGEAVLVRIGSRGSRLALTQAELAAARIREAGHAVTLVPITTTGDRDRSRPFGQIGERGVFVKELEEALLGGRVDVAVHSAKDMTSTDTDGLVVGAYLERDDPRDALDRRRRDPARDADRHRVGAAEGAAPRARARRSRSSRSAATSTRASRRRASAASTRSSSRRAGSTGSGSPARSACGCRPRRCSRRRDRARSRSRCAPASEELVAHADDAETRRRVEAERACAAAIGAGCLAPGRGAPRRRGCCTR